MRLAQAFAQEDEGFVYPDQFADIATKSGFRFLGHDDGFNIVRLQHDGGIVELPWGHVLEVMRRSSLAHAIRNLVPGAEVKRLTSTLADESIREPAFLDHDWEELFHDLCLPNAGKRLKAAFHDCQEETRPEVHVQRFYDSLLKCDYSPPKALNLCRALFDPLDHSGQIIEQAAIHAVRRRRKSRIRQPKRYGAEI